MTLYTPKKVAVFLEMAGINKDGTLSGSYAGAKNFINATHQYSEHNVTFFSTKVTDPELLPYIDTTNYFTMPHAQLETLLQEFDVVHVLNGKATALKISSVTPNAILGPNVVFNFPHPENLSAELKEKYKQPLLEEKQISFANWSYILTPNPNVEPLYQRRFTGQHGPIIAMPYGVNIERFHPEPNTERDQIVWIGGGPNRPGKGNDLIEKVQAALPNLNWVLLGKDSPFQYGTQIPHLQRAKVYVVTTAHETQGIATFEAMACGAPILIANYKFDSHDTKGYHEQTPIYHIDGITSKVVPRNVNDIVDGIKFLLQNDNHREQLAQRSHAYAKDYFSLQAMIRQYDAIISRKIQEDKLSGLHLRSNPFNPQYSLVSNHPLFKPNLES